ncbi:hypothetical protein VP01_5275g1 [Puccinia sorghi]|uniref:Uncharacterized protein n=1 Tax=Puccinia sorghi TaxID=27349 RepID=A0A0L6UKD6_9BASI|nr:hypothetical protein VP01_5275g1 [Puccinia sorghi]
MSVTTNRHTDTHGDYWEQAGAFLGIGLACCLMGCDWNYQCRLQLSGVQMGAASIGGGSCPSCIAIKDAVVAFSEFHCTLYLPLRLGLHICGVNFCGLKSTGKIHQSHFHNQYSRLIFDTLVTTVSNLLPKFPGQKLALLQLINTAVGFVCLLISLHIETVSGLQSMKSNHQKIKIKIKIKTVLFIKLHTSKCFLHSVQAHSFLGLNYIKINKDWNYISYYISPHFWARSIVATAPVMLLNYMMNYSDGSGVSIIPRQEIPGMFNFTTLDTYGIPDCLISASQEKEAPGYLRTNIHFQQLLGRTSLLYPSSVSASLYLFNILAISTPSLHPSYQHISQANIKKLLNHYTSRLDQTIQKSLNYLITKFKILIVQFFEKTRSSEKSQSGMIKFIRNSFLERSIVHKLSFFQ